jgi:hypothetical protein
MDVSIEGTAFATCLLSATRTISLFFPFYQINRKAVAIATLIFLVQEVLRCLIFKIYFNNINPSETFRSPVFGKNLMTIMILTVVLLTMLSSILSSWKLLKKRQKFDKATVDHRGQAQQTNNNQKATVTIVIVSFLFCFFNTVFCISLYFGFFEFPPETSFSELVVLALRGFALLLAIPFNSAVNPIVYFVRKKDMRAFIKELIPKTACM